MTSPGPVTLGPQGSARRSLVLSLIAVTVVVLGCLGGAAIHVSASRSHWMAPVEAASDTPPLSEAEAEAPIPVRAAPKGLRLRQVSVSAPEDPFQPTQADPAPSVAVSPARGNAPVLPGADAPAGPAPAGTRQPVKRSPAAPLPADLTVVGVIQGEPPLAVVRYSGESFFLKVGDQVAEAWRLAEIKERSAVFELGGQRVEIPIRGGSSE